MTIEPLDWALPGPVFFMPSMAYLQPRNTPSELIASTRRQFSTVVFSIVPEPPPTPALLTMMSSRPSLLQHVGQQRLPGVLGGDVVLHEAAGGVLGLLDVGHDDRGAGALEQRGGGRADARGAAGDDGDLS